MSKSNSNQVQVDLVPLFPQPPTDQQAVTITANRDFTRTERRIVQRAAENQLVIDLEAVLGADAVQRETQLETFTTQKFVEITETYSELTEARPDKPRSREHQHYLDEWRQFGIPRSANFKVTALQTAE